jgi:thiol-disulfide isomerase/thioredoxin
LLLQFLKSQALSATNLEIRVNPPMPLLPALRRLALTGPLLVCLWSLGCTESAPNTGAPSPETKPAANSTAETAGEVTLLAATPQELAAAVAAHKGKVVLVDYWATYCAPCRQQFPHTVQMSQELAKQGFVAISVCCDEPEKEAEALSFLKKSGATFENFRSSLGGDEEALLAFEIDGGALPHYKLYARNGELLKAFGTDPTADRQFTSEDIEQQVVQALQKQE